MGKVIQFRKKPNLKQTMKMSRAKEIAHFLIDECDTEFALIFKTKDMNHIFEGGEQKDFIVALSDISKRKVSHDDYFFTGFNSRQYFDLNSQ